MGLMCPAKELGPCPAGNEEPLKDLKMWSNLPSEN